MPRNRGRWPPTSLLKALWKLQDAHVLIHRVQGLLEVVVARVLVRQQQRHLTKQGGVHTGAVQDDKDGEGALCGGARVHVLPYQHAQTGVDGSNVPSAQVMAGQVRFINLCIEPKRCVTHWWAGALAQAQRTHASLALQPCYAPMICGQHLTPPRQQGTRSSQTSVHRARKRP